MADQGCAGEIYGEDIVIEIMRLFIAIQFEENILDALTDFQGDLRSQGVTGNYTRRENLHITLALRSGVQKTRPRDGDEMISAQQIGKLFSVEIVVNHPVKFGPHGKRMAFVPSGTFIALILNAGHG